MHPELIARLEARDYKYDHEPVREGDTILISLPPHLRGKKNQPIEFRQLWLDVDVPKEPDLHSLDFSMLNYSWPDWYFNVTVRRIRPLWQMAFRRHQTEALFLIGMMRKDLPEDFPAPELDAASTSLSSLLKRIDPT